MTHLRKMMLEELQRRNYSESTTRCYIRTVEDFARRFKCSPDRLGPRHIREYQAELFQKAKLSPRRLRNVWRLCGFSTSRRSRGPGASPRLPIRKRYFAYQRSSARKKWRDSSMQLCTPYHRTLLMTLYATGVRRAELTHLKVSDIDSQRMVIHVQGGKGRKDRDVMLSPKAARGVA